MADAARGRLRDEEGNQWQTERARAVGHRQEDEDRGRAIWNASTRAGTDHRARTTEELRVLGERERRAREISQEARTEALGRADATERVLRRVGGEANAAVRSAANMLTFGGADHFAAGMDALIQPGGIQNWRGRYEANLERERAQNKHDETSHPIGVRIGQVGGLIPLGLARGGLALAPRLPGAAALSGREGLALAGAGAATGVGLQTGFDVATGRRSSPGDVAGAALGGAAGAASLPLGAVRAGAIDAGVTSIAQDVLNGRPISLERAGQSASAGRVLGGVADGAGRRAADGMSGSAKGRLGELIGDVRSTVNGHRREWAPKSRDYVLPGGRYWYPDGRSGSIRFEDKFGYGAKLSPNQRSAQSVLGPDFQLYYSNPDDIGKLLGVPASSAGAQVVPRRK